MTGWRRWVAAVAGLTLGATMAGVPPAWAQQSSAPVEVQAPAQAPAPAPAQPPGGQPQVPTEGPAATPAVVEEKGAEHRPRGAPVSNLKSVNGNDGFVPIGSVGLSLTY